MIGKNEKVIKVTKEATSLMVGVQIAFIGDRVADDVDEHEAGVLIQKALDQAEQRTKKKIIEKLEKHKENKDFKYAPIERIDGYLDALDQAIKTINHDKN